jgi:hypothetical protein
VLGYYQQDNGILDGSWLIVDEIELIKSLINHTAPPKPIRTRDFKSEFPYVFPIAHYIEQAKSLMFANHETMPTKILHAFRLFDSDESLAVENDCDDISFVVQPPLTRKVIDGVQTPPDPFIAVELDGVETPPVLPPALGLDGVETPPVLPPAVIDGVKTPPEPAIPRKVGRPSKVKPPDWEYSDWQNLGKKTQQRLTQEWKESEAAQLAGNQPSTSSSSSGLPAKSLPPVVHIVEFCCSDDSQLGVVAIASGLISHRFSMKFADLTTKAGIQKATAVLQAIPITDVVHLWGAVPCTPWTSFVKLNLHIHPNTYPTKLRILRLTSMKLVEAFTKLAQLVMSRGASNSVSFEWPKGAKEGWEHPKVVQMVKKLKLCFCALFDGCMLGVRSIAPKTKGKLIKKPWQVLSTCESLTVLLSKHKCDRGHPHVPCEGIDT